MTRYLLLLLLGLWLPSACSKEAENAKAQTEPESAAFIIHFRSPPTEKNLQFSLTEGALEVLSDDSFGRRFALRATTSTTALIIKRDGKEIDRLPFVAEGEGVWFFAGSRKGFSSAPPLLPQNDRDLVVYFVPGSGEAGTQDWGLHIWDPKASADLTRWDTPLPLREGAPDYPYAARLNPPPDSAYGAAPSSYQDFPAKLGLIVHSGDLKGTPETLYEPARHGNVIFVGGKEGRVYCSPDLRPCGWEAQVDAAAAHWVKSEELLWRVDGKAARYLLLASPTGKIDIASAEAALEDRAVIQLPLVKNETISQTVKAEYPHLTPAYVSFGLKPAKNLAALLKSELLLVALNESSRVLAATRPQIGGVLDENYAYAGELGLLLNGEKNLLKLWAPTAQTVSLNIYARDKTLQSKIPMSEEDGVWSAEIPQPWIKERLYYRYEMKVYHPLSGLIEQYEVTDPYAVSGSHNGEWSQLLDLDDPALKPAGWDSSGLSPVRRPSDMVFYEAHIRDFSAHDESVPPELRGSYEAFALNGLNGRPLSRGMQHLKRLQEAGLTHVQVLPAYDFGSVEEDRRKTVNLYDPFAKLCALLTRPASEDLCQTQAQSTIFDVFSKLPRDGQGIAELNNALIERDSFNWGYDPVHYGMPDGSYVSRGGAEGEARVLQFRQMAQGLSQIGIHLAMDVVYNHTYSSGLSPTSVLDKVVPGYYHRLNPISGAVERSSCCENTASERKMMEKLMIDTLKRWHKDYKVDAFRFDLMGLHFKENMLNVQKALGPEVYLFGEGWAMGELNADARNQSTARQLNMAGTGIGTFNDRFRDAVRGGGPFDCGVQLTQQSPLNGLFFDDNGRGGLLLEPSEGEASCTDPSTYKYAPLEMKKARLFAMQDLLRLGLAGTLREYEMLTSEGKKVRGRDLDYSGQAAGYTAAPSETINYIENHDNQTFWDISQLKLPYSLTMDERVRVHGLGLAFNMLAMGVPYFEMGAEFLRSKSLVRDSYNAGDWFNQVDFKFERSNWNRGLPAVEKDGQNLAVIRDVVRNVPEGPSGADMQKAIGLFLDFLSMRKDSPLFRLSTALEVQERIDFIEGTEQLPGVIAMRIRDEAAPDLDPRYEEILVVFNLTPSPARLAYAKKMELHPIQLRGLDETVKKARADGQTIEVPPRTAAVFVK